MEEPDTPGAVGDVLLQRFEERGHGLGYRGTREDELEHLGLGFRERVRRACDR